MDIHETERNLNNKISRGGLQCGVLASMSERDRSGVHTAVTALFVVVLVCFSVMAIYSIGASTALVRQKQQSNSANYAAQAEKDIQDRCLLLDETDIANCIREVIEATNEHERAENDLVAQSGMATWALGMLIVSAAALFATIVGVFYVRSTLLETRRIGQGQVRAYVAESEISIEWDQDAHPPQIKNIEAKFANGGQSPALMCRPTMQVHGLGPEEFGGPIKEATELATSIRLGTITIPAGRSVWASAGEISAEHIAKWLSGDHQMLIHCVVRYRDVFGEDRFTESCSVAVHTVKPDGRTRVRFRMYNHHNHAT